MAASGILMFAVGLEGEHCRLTLPAFADVPAFREALQRIEQAAGEAELTGLVLGGYPPPTDASIKWTTVTPDPGALEINTAPHASVAAYAHDTLLMHRLAGEIGLTAQRLYYNGDIVDSGGGGQITFGGPSPEASPFFVQAQLLPRLVTYFNRHPSLSYWLGLDAVGGSSQAPRPDEGARETFEEMGVALDALRKHGDVAPPTLWATLAPHLSDRFGNPHRSEINIEKLWNPFLPMRGKLGLVELRALRMARSPERAIATAVLLRSILGYLATHEYDEPLADWGAELHGRFALPFFLERDFAQVLADLATGGFAIGEALTGELLDDSDCFIGSAQLDGAELRVRRAREFWPLLGDLSQERGTHRLVDSSTARIEVALHAESDQAGEGWELSVDGYRVPLVAASSEGRGFCKVAGIRYRACVPALSLHPLVGAHGPLVLQLRRAGRMDARVVSLFDWAPDGIAYDGLPQDAVHAQCRRAARFVVECIDEAAPTREAPARALSPFGVDTRRF